MAAILAVVAFLVAVAFFPLTLLGPRVVEVFPAGNPVGSTGELLNDRLRALLGVGRAAVPLGVLAVAASVGHWWAPQRRKSLWIVTVVLLLLLPVSAFLAGGGDSASGMVGAALGGPLRDTVGWLGGWVLVGAVAVGASVAAFPVQPACASGDRRGQGVPGYGARPSGVGRGHGEVAGPAPREAGGEAYGTGGRAGSRRGAGRCGRRAIRR